MAATRIRGKAFSEEEEQFVIDSFTSGKLSAREIGERLGRSDQSIFTLAYNLRKAGKLPPGRKKQASNTKMGGGTEMEIEQAPAPAAVPMPDPKTCAHFRLSGNERIQQIFPAFFETYNVAALWQTWEVCIKCGDVRKITHYNPHTGVENPLPEPASWPQIYVPQDVRAMAATLAFQAPPGRIANPADAHRIIQWPKVAPAAAAVPLPIVAFTPPAIAAAPLIVPGFDVRQNAAAAAYVDAFDPNEADPLGLLMPPDDTEESLDEWIGRKGLGDLAERPETPPAEPPVDIPGEESPTEPLLYSMDVPVTDAELVEELTAIQMELSEQVIELRERLHSVEQRAMEVIEADQAGWKAELRGEAAKMDAVMSRAFDNILALEMEVEEKDKRIAQLQRQLDLAERVIYVGWGIAKGIAADARAVVARLEGYGR